MNRLIAQFNETVGREKGIVIDVTVMTNSSVLGPRLLDAHANKPGASSSRSVWNMSWIGRTASVMRSSPILWRSFWRMGWWKTTWLFSRYPNPLTPCS